MFHQINVKHTVNFTSRPGYTVWSTQGGANTHSHILSINDTLRFFCGGLFTDAYSNSICTASNGWVINTCWITKDLKWNFCGQFEVTIEHLPVSFRKTTKYLRQVSLWPGLGISKLTIWVVTVTLSCSVVRCWFSDGNVTSNNGLHDLMIAGCYSKMQVGRLQDAALTGALTERWW